MKRIIVIPAYEPSDKLLEVINSIDKSYDIIVVNDGSGEYYNNIFNSIPKYVKVLGYDNNMGKGHALKYAFQYIRANYDNYIVITMDADGQHSIKDAIRLGDYGITTGIHVYDTQTGLRAFTNRLMDRMLSVSGDRFEYEMNVLLECARNNINIHEIEIETIYIDNNRSSHFNGVRDSYLIYKDIFKYLFTYLLTYMY